MMISGSIMSVSVLKTQIGMLEKGMTLTYADSPATMTGIHVLLKGMENEGCIEITEVRRTERQGKNVICSIKVTKR